MPESHDPRRLNAVKHGCCAKSPVLPGEHEVVWRVIEDEWLAEYDPQTPISRTLVGEAALAFWHMRRNRRQFELVQRSLAEKQPFDWTEEDHRKYSRFLRYQTAAERAFSTAFKNLEYIRKARLNETAALLRLELKLDALQEKEFQQITKLDIEHAKLEFEKWKHIEDCKAKGIPTSITLTPRPPRTPEQPTEESAPFTPPLRNRSRKTKFPANKIPRK